MPCEACVQRRIHCEVDEETDERRRIGHKRRLEVLDRDRCLLLRLLETLKDEDRTQASGILHLIRSEASLEEIGLRLSANLENSAVSDNALYRVPAWPWTMVTQDSHLISHLISLYFCWPNVILGWIDRALFIRHDVGSPRIPVLLSASRQRHSRRRLCKCLVKGHVMQPIVNELTYLSFAVI